MNSFSPSAYKVLLVLAVLSGVYFSSLVLHLSGIVTLLFLLLGGVAIFRLPAFWLCPDAIPHPDEFPKRAAIVFYVSLLLLCIATFLLACKWGSSDALSIWNLSAQALSDPDHWRKLFQYTRGHHTDYPLFLPSLNALFLRFLPVEIWYAVPVFFAALSTIIIPIWLFFRLGLKHIGVGIGALLLFLTNAFYLNIGMAQGGDVWLSLWILAAFFAFEDAWESSSSRLYTISGLFIGMGACTKNEGILAALCFFLLMLTYLPANKKVIFVFAGAFIPLLYVFLFKEFLAPDGDIFQGQKQSILQLLTTKERYRLIWESFQKEVHSYFFFSGTGLVLYAFHCLLKVRLPHRYLLFVITMLAGYGGIFLITPLDLPWHLIATKRLILQLFPLIVYTLGKEAIAISPVVARSEE